MEPPIQPFDWQRMLIDEFPWLFLGEVAFRTMFMFGVLLIALTASGKREVRQLSVYELVLVIGLGSAAGDPMFYHDVPLAAAVTVFIVMIACHKLATFISDRNRAVRNVIEGKAVYVIEDGCILFKNLDREELSLDELLSELRQKDIEQLGQVRVAIIEPTGQVSVFPFEPDAVKSGMPILPKEFDKKTDHVDVPGQYACCTCGQVETYHQPTRQPICTNCGKSVWVAAIQ